MYTYDSNEFHPTGVYYATYRPLFYEILAPLGSNTLIAGSTSTGSRTTISSGPGSGTGLGYALPLYDTSGAWGAGADTLQGTYQFLPTVPGSDGNGGVGGYYVMCGFLEMSGSNAGSRILGADLEYYNQSTTVLTTTGSHQSMATNKNNCAFYMDLVPTGIGASWGQGSFGYNSGYPYVDAAFIQDTSLATYTAVGPNGIPSTEISNGEGSRHWEFWAAVNAGSWGHQNTIGTPTASWPVGADITSTVMQDALAEPLQWLGYPVSFRAATQAGQTVNGATVMEFPPGTSTIITPTASGEGHWNAADTYTIPVAGLYLFHGVVSITSASNSGNFNAGANINGTYYWGPSYGGNASTAGVISATKTQIFSLKAGDTVQLMGRSSLSISSATGYYSRFMLQWLGDNGAAIGGPSNIGNPVTTYRVPDPTFRWQAGTPGNVLQYQFQQHLGNDIGFLFNRPYFMGYQTSSTSLTTNGTWSNAAGTGMALQDRTGAVWGDNGDPWGGWVSADTWWTAPVNGWYLVVSEQTIATTNAPTGLCAGIGCPKSGGKLPATGGNGPTASPDWYQHILLASSPALPNGATAAGLYYLLAGESVFIAGRPDGPASVNFSTNVDMAPPAWSTTHMEVVWIGA
jgi:hypothetical protein